MSPRLLDALARPFDPVGRAVGRAAEAAFRAHHLRRLRRTGHLAAGAPIVAVRPTTFPLRAGNAARVLIDGQAAFAEIAAALASATDTVHVTGWVAEAGFALVRDGEHRVTLGEALADAAARGVRVRVLLWAGAPVPAIHPTRADARASAEALNALDGVVCVLDAREYPLDCHHEKTVIVDDRVAFVGGLDLSDLKSDRWDAPGHPQRPGDGWHDAAIRVAGPVVADVASHFALRWGEVAGERLPRTAEPPASGSVSVQVVRTIPERVYPALADGDFGVLAAYLENLRSARRFVYLENQFLWAVEVVDLLVEKLTEPPSDDFRLVVVLPDKAHTGQDASLGQLSRLIEADAGAGRFLAATVQSTTPGHDVYVHIKVGIVDDRWITVGSANLNAHSLFNDTELNVCAPDADLARSTREALWLEHTGVDAAGIDPITYIDTVLRPVCHEQTRRLAAALPPTAGIRRLDHVTRRGDLMKGPLSALLLDS